VDFAGRLERADDIALTFLLASEGKLGIMQRQKPRRYIKDGSRKLSIPAELMKWRSAGITDPKKLCLEDRRLRLCRPPAGRVPGESGRRAQAPGKPGNTSAASEGGRAAEALGQTGNTSAAGAGTWAGLCRPDEELRPDEWASWAGKREANYAVLALDRGQAEQLMEYRQKEGYPRKDNVRGDAAKALSIVAAAHCKGQGLLLTVEEVSADEYEEHRLDLAELHFEKYGYDPCPPRYSGLGFF
jgi:hypothetical protein